MQIDERAQVALDILEQNGYEAYVVGGCVRDSLMGHPPHDWDICTAALPQQVAACFGAYPIIETGLIHGTVTVVLQGLPLEITTYRQDGEYTDNRHPASVAFVRSLKEDLARRDFTINAMAYNPKTGLQDYWGGAADVQNGVVRAVGQPGKRLQEDGLRILRALRFASRLGFCIEPQLQNTIHQKRQLLCNIAAERINTELCGILTSKGVLPVLLEYPDVLQVFIPEIGPMVGFVQNNPHHIYTVWQHTAVAVQNAPSQAVLRLAMLLHDIGKPLTYTEDEKGVGHFYGHSKASQRLATQIVKRLKFDNDTIKAVTELVKWHDLPLEPARVRKWMSKLGQQRFAQLLEVKRADVLAQAPAHQQKRLLELHQLEEEMHRVTRQNLCISIKDLAINGNDLMELGLAPGPLYKQILNELLQLVVEEKLPNQKAELLQHAKKLASSPGGGKRVK